MTRSPPLRRIIPIFLWLKLKETWWLWLFLALEFTVVRTHLLPWLIRVDELNSSGEHIFAWFVVSVLNAILILIIIVLLYLVKEALIPWLRSNWQQATKLAKAREMNR